MREFTYSRPTTEAQAVALTAIAHTSVIAGGTELLNWMRLGVVAPQHVVDIARLPGRREIALKDETLLVGGLADLNQVGEHPLVESHATVLSEACLAAASAQLRNRATLGGNVLQRTRCPYFRAEEPLPWGCNKRLAGSGCSARHGINDEHAIFGWTDACVATHPSDPLVALACLDAEVDLLSAHGTRRIAVSELHLTQSEAELAGKESAQYESTLRPGELIVGYRIPVRAGARSSYVKVRERQSYAYALVSAAASVTMEHGVVAAIRLVLGSVAQRPWLLGGIESALVGQPLTEVRLAAAIDGLLEEARPLSGNGYKVRLARNAAVRAAMQTVP
jgi:xanthine dehydrogenase YagS FAD-binding subunit